jgi:hypothetical protein
VANKVIVVLFLSETIWWQFSQPIPTAEWTNLPSFFSGWQVKHVSGLRSFGSMNGCSMGSSAQSWNDGTRRTTKGKKWRVRLDFGCFADHFADANAVATRAKNLRARTAQQGCLHRQL